MTMLRDPSAPVEPRVIPQSHPHALSWYAVALRVECPSPYTPPTRFPSEFSSSLCTPSLSPCTLSLSPCTPSFCVHTVTLSMHTVTLSMHTVGLCALCHSHCALPVTRYTTPLLVHSLNTLSLSLYTVPLHHIITASHPLCPLSLSMYAVHFHHQLPCKPPLCTATLPVHRQSLCTLSFSIHNATLHVDCHSLLLHLVGPSGASVFLCVSIALNSITPTLHSTTSVPLRKHLKYGYAVYIGPEIQGRMSVHKICSMATAPQPTHPPVQAPGLRCPPCRYWSHGAWCVPPGLDVYPRGVMCRHGP